MKRQHPDNPELFWCPKCETYKARGEFPISKADLKHGISSSCRPCMKIYHAKIWELKKQDPIFMYQFNEKARKWKAEHPDRMRERRREGRERHPEWDSNVSLELRNRYVRGLLVRAGVIVNSETLELRRQQLIMKRTLKQFKQWREENEPDHTDVPGVEHADEINNEGGIQT